jgi:hypothetical protein
MTTTRLFAALLILFVVGCGPTRTAGTRGVAAKDLSVLSIAQLPRESPVQLRTIQFGDAGEQYKIGKGRDFYLLPRDQTASVTLLARVPKGGGAMGKLAGVLLPNGALTIPGPTNIPLGPLSPGKTYELAGSAEDFAGMLQNGGLSLVREKTK